MITVLHKRSGLTRLIGAVLLLGGCESNPYLEAKRNTAPGGANDQSIATARTDLDSARAQNIDLGDQKGQRERELERTDKRIRAVEADLRRQDDALASALKSNRLTQARYDELKRQTDAIRAETREVDMQNRGSALGPADPKANARKEARLRELERRRKILEEALGTLAKQ